MKVVINFTEKQTAAHLHLTDDQDAAVLYGGAKGGGKSHLFCIWAWTWTCQLIQFFGINKVKHPIPLGFIGRKRAVDFNDTTLETFKRVVPYTEYKIRAQEKEIIINGKAKILYGGLDDQETINKFNSAEFAFIGIDQAEETLRKDVSVLQAALRFVYNGKTPPYKELYTANPAECWLKEDFIIGNRPNSVFIPALPDDNPYLPDNYKSTLREAFAYDEALLKAYLEGDWDAFSRVEDALFAANTFIPCRNLADETDPEYDPVIIAADIATKHGECETAICLRVGDTIKNIFSYKRLSAVESSNVIQNLYEKHNAETIVIDSDGFGEGVSDILISRNVPVQEFHGGYGHQAIDSRRFKNLRSQFYVITAKKIEKGLMCLSQLDQGTYEKLKSQCCQIKLKKPDGLARYQVESKEDMAARGIKSPDLADVIVYSEWGLWMSRCSDVQDYCYR